MTVASSRKGQVQSTASCCCRGPGRDGAHQESDTIVWGPEDQARSLGFTHRALERFLGGREARCTLGSSRSRDESTETVPLGETFGFLCDQHIWV